MPLFYFDLKDGEAMAVDEEGMEFSDLEAAVEEATRVLATFVRQAEENPERSYLSEMTVEIRDEGGLVTEVSHRDPTTH
jgi:hypothetical protein